MAQDDYYYEIQLTNKQLVFYFMAGAAGLILAFLAGVMVGRGLENGSGGTVAEQARAVAEEKVVTEQAATPTPAPTDFSYPQRLESEKQPDGLEKPAASPATAVTTTPAHPATAVTTTPARPAAAVATPAPTPKPLPTLPAAKPTPPPQTAQTAQTAPAAAAHAGLPKPIGSTASVKGFAVQVGAFKDRASADSVVKNLKSRSLPAYTVSQSGLFTVRVGVYRDRADADAVQERLRDDKFKPYIIKQ